MFWNWSGRFRPSLPRRLMRNTGKQRSCVAADAQVGDEYEKIILGYEKGEIRESLKRLQEYLEYENEEEMFASILETKPHASVLIRILGLVQAEFWEFKRRHNIYEFQDVAKMAIRLLEENPDIREYLREHTHEILIDEYQDTNDFQEILISLLAEDNVYMVGTSNSRFTVSGTPIRKSSSKVPGLQAGRSRACD